MCRRNAQMFHSFRKCSDPVSTQPPDYAGRYDQDDVGQVSEIFDGDAPHTPRGCVAQAWSVSEILRAAVEDAHVKKDLLAATESATRV
jgi:hypothetical protein